MQWLTLAKGKKLEAVDPATIIGLLLAWGAVVAAMMMYGGSAAKLLNPAALVLVVGGTLGATIMAFSLRQILRLPTILRNAFFCRTTEPAAAVTLMVECARLARREGVLTLEYVARKVDDRFVQLGIRLVVDGTPSALVRELLETEIVSLQERHKVGERIFATMGGFAPTMGIIGTVIGLIHMLNNLGDTSAMGPAIASAFTATLYGVALANLVLLPIGSKLKSRTTDEILVYDMLLEGILSIQAGDNPRMVEQKMLAFLPQGERHRLVVESAVKAA